MAGENNKVVISLLCKLLPAACARKDRRENIRVTGATLRKVHLDKVSRISYYFSRKVANGRLFIRQEVSYH